MAGKKSRRDRGHRRQGDKQRGGQRSAPDSEARARIERWVAEDRLPAMLITDDRPRLMMYLCIEPDESGYRARYVNRATGSDLYLAAGTLSAMLESISRACPLEYFRPRDELARRFQHVEGASAFLETG